MIYHICLSLEILFIIVETDPLMFMFMFMFVLPLLLWKIIKGLKKTYLQSTAVLLTRGTRDLKGKGTTYA